jgi:AbrB family looped-hinge helix DNA binding protein
MKHTSRPHGKPSRSAGVSEPAAEYAAGPVVTIDATGRMVLPKKIREHYGADRFVVRETKGHIELVPVKSVSSLLGILPDLDLKSLYRDHDREVAEEDEE